MVIWIGGTICALHKNAQAGIISNQCHIFVQLVEAAKVEMSLIESFAGDYRRWSRIEQIVSPAFLIAALGGVASMFTPLLGGWTRHGRRSKDRVSTLLGLQNTVEPYLRW